MVEAVMNIDAIDRAVCRKAVEGYFSTGRMVREHADLFLDIVGR